MDIHLHKGVTQRFWENKVFQQFGKLLPQALKQLVLNFSYVL